jgi:ABC-2 type transport system permease protein
MTRTLISLTLRQLLGRRRALFLVVLALIPVLVAILYRFGSDHVDPPPVEFAPDLLDTLLLAIVLPVTALIFGTAALGAEIEDGTAVYLLTKPIERWRILLVKVGVASAATIALALPTALLTSLIILGGDDPHGISVGFGLGVVVGATAYCALFVALSVRTSRALLIGLAYVFVWEAILPSIFDGTRWVSVRQYMLGLADLVSSAPASALEADLGGGSAAVAAALLVAASILVGNRLISRFEIGERL